MSAKMIFEFATRELVASADGSLVGQMSYERLQQTFREVGEISSDEEIAYIEFGKDRLKYYLKRKDGAA